MKRFTKVFAAAVAISTVLLTGCGDSAGSSTSTSTGDTSASDLVSNVEVEETTGDSDPVSGTEETTDDSASDSEYGADVAAIIDRGVLRVGVKNAVVGFGFQDTLTGEYSGMEISIAEKIADTLGVDIEFTTVTAATRTELLDSGDIDCVLATFTITDERKESWDFSTPYYTDYVSVLVENTSGITSLADLVDKKVGVSSGSTSARSLVSAMIDEGLVSEEGFDADTFDAAMWTTGVSFQQYDDYPAISTALSAGEVDAFCVDKSILAVYNTDSRSYIEDQFAPQDYGVATSKDSDFSVYVEDLITQWLADGTIQGFIEENNLQ